MDNKDINAPHWIMYLPSPHTGKTSWFTCSACGETGMYLQHQGTEWDVYTNGYHFCPRCGAKMQIPVKRSRKEVLDARPPMPEDKIPKESMQILQKIVREIVDEYLKSQK